MYAWFKGELMMCNIHIGLLNLTLSVVPMKVNLSLR